MIPRASIFELATPSTVDAGDASSVELGVKFTSDVAGSVTGIRFYKAAGQHRHARRRAVERGRARSSARGRSAGESASGWQTVTFASPVAISANTTYVASYLAPNGHYSLTRRGFASSAVDNPPLHALANSTSANGVYLYSGISAFPTSSFNASNYWVDVLFAPDVTMNANRHAPPLPARPGDRRPTTLTACGGTIRPRPQPGSPAESAAAQSRRRLGGAAAGRPHQRGRDAAAPTGKPGYQELVQAPVAPSRERASRRATS